MGSNIVGNQAGINKRIEGHLGFRWNWRSTTAKCQEFTMARQRAREETRNEQGTTYSDQEGQREEEERERGRGT